ncbi:uncharacterized protein RCC_12095 [Ramularia collo-cygni]|uniref:Uncharacterized protein n=1 Tax=Ramularia collo-cygni TaxID=112498 RepID=A0A2D3ULV9_9PEZI|nr:uncharacterized protein RCC_12095 [Ramularia collo-cygni]CZT15612.1 uncharacterized protein RCC_12095 [Ramularia collo-cygni]
MTSVPDGRSIGMARRGTARKRSLPRKSIGREVDNKSCLSGSKRFDETDGKFGIVPYQSGGILGAVSDQTFQIETANNLEVLIMMPSFHCSLITCTMLNAKQAPAESEHVEVV